MIDGYADCLHTGSIKMRKTIVTLALLLGFLPLPFCGSLAHAMEVHDMDGKTMIHAAMYDVMPCCLNAHEDEGGHNLLDEHPFRLSALDTSDTACVRPLETPKQRQDFSTLLHPDRGKFEEQGGIKRE